MAEHIHRFTQSLDVWRHPWYRHWARDDLDAYCEFVREETDLRLGIEADFLPGREDRMATLLDGAPWDYVVGSLHFLSDEAVDLHGYPTGTSGIWRSRPREGLEEILRDARGGGAQRPVRHPRPPRPREGLGRARAAPEGDLRRFYELAMDGIAESDVAIEVSTAGLRKPVGGDLPRSRLSRALPGGGPAGGAVERRPRARAARPRVRARRWNGCAAWA